MLTEYRVQTTLPATDFERATRFYGEKLRVTPTETGPDGAGYDCADGTAFFLFPTSIANRGGHTQAAFEVPDIEAAVAELTSRGVVFEEYDMPELTTVEGIATLPDGGRAAWFKDSEGNLLALGQLS